MMIRREIVVSNPVRTAIGTFDGSLKTVPATELGAMERSKLKGSDVDAAVMGNVIQAGNKMNPARQSAVNGGLPVDVPAMTINRVCGSGAQAVVSAAQDIMLGLANCAVAGGMENMASSAES
jgi:acetyl-CoA C-acetyltransferase